MIVEEGEPALAWIAGRPRRRRYPATVRSETSKPSFSSSPWISGRPVRIRRHGTDQIPNLVVHPWPAASGRDRQRQYRRKPARCHPTTVSGFTITTSVHRDHDRRSTIQNNRSRKIYCGAWTFAFQHSDLLAESEDFDRYIRAAAEEHAQRRQECKQKIEHKRPL